MCSIYDKDKIEPIKMIFADVRNIRKIQLLLSEYKWKTSLPINPCQLWSLRHPWPFRSSSGRDNGSLQVPLQVPNGVPVGHHLHSVP